MSNQPRVVEKWEGKHWGGNIANQPAMFFPVCVSVCPLIRQVTKIVRNPSHQMRVKNGSVTAHARSRDRNFA